MSELIEIEESWDGRGDQYGGTLTDATADMSTDIAAAITGYGQGRTPDRDASLCKSLDGIAAAIRELAEAVRDKS